MADIFVDPEYPIRVVEKVLDQVTMDVVDCKDKVIIQYGK